MNDAISCIPSIIKLNIPKIYKSKPIIYMRIYKSCLLSMLDRFSLSQEYESNLERRLNSPTFDEVAYYRRHLDDNIILWHLPKSFESIVKIILNKCNITITRDIKDLLEVDITDDELSFIAFSGGNDASDY